jgi:putative effector of murein hydrolase
MMALRGLAVLLLLQVCGELLARALPIPLPGPVLGMVLLLLALQVRWVRVPVQAGADALLSHLSLLFVPVGVGVITHLDLVSQYGLRLIVVIVLSTWIGLAVTALLLRGFLRVSAKELRAVTDSSNLVLSSTPLFGLTATLVTRDRRGFLRPRQPRTWANPVLWSVVIIGAFLVATHTSYPVYFAGAQFIHVLLGPAVVALGWPFWQRRPELRRRGLALTVAALVGARRPADAVALGWALGMPGDVLRSLAPKSVTAPVAMGIAERIGGVPHSRRFRRGDRLRRRAVSEISVRLLRIRRWRYADSRSAPRRMAWRRAGFVDPDAGAYAGIALGLQVLLASFLLPLASRWFT